MDSRVKAAGMLAIGVVVFIGAMLLAFRGAPPSAKPPYVSSSAQPDGLKAVRLLLEENGRRVHTWSYSWLRLMPSDRRPLVVVEPQGAGDEEREAIRRWVESGGRMLLFDAKPSGYDGIYLENIPNDAARSGRITAEAGASAYGVQAGTVFAGNLESRVRIRPEERVTPLFRDSLGIIAADIGWGEGRVTVFLESAWLTNGRVLEQEHFAMVWPLLREAGTEMRIDEYHHGFRKQPGLFSIYPAWLLLAFIQLALACGAWIWLRGRRFGPVYIPREWVVRRGDESLLAIAGWYERRGCRREAFLEQERYFRSLLQERWGLSPAVSDEEILRMARLRWEEPHANRLAALLRRFADMRPAEGDEGRPGPAYEAKTFVRDTELAAQVVNRLEKG